MKFSMQNGAIYKFIIKHGLNMFFICLSSLIFFAVFAVSVKQITGLSLSKFLPGYSDMAGYYIEINAAAKNGIFSHNAGYNGYIWYPGMLSTADNLFYGAHGLFILLPYIFMAKVIGWNGADPLIIHTVLLTIAFLFVYFSTRSLKKALISQIITFTFIPFLLYFPTTMMEIQMYAWSIILIALIYAYVKHPNKINHIGLLVCVVFASAARITNIVYIIPYFILTMKEFSGKKNVLKLTMGFFAVACVLILYLVNIRFSAPYPSSFVSRFFSELGHMDNAFHMFSKHFRDSIKLYIKLNTENIFSFLRYSVVCFALLLLLVKRFDTEFFFLSVILLTIALLNIMFYDVFDWRDFRVMAPVFLSTVIYVLINYEKLFTVACIGILLCLSFWVFSPIAVKAIRAHFGEFYHNEFAKYVYYDPNAATRYGNTVVSNISDTAYDIDAGLGVIAAFEKFTTKEMASLGVRYIVTDGNMLLDDIDVFYQIAAQGDHYIVYQLNGERLK